MSKYKSKIATNPAVEMIHIAMEGDAPALAWAKKESFPWPTLLQADHKKAGVAKFAKPYVPYYALVDQNGKTLAEGPQAVFDQIDSLTSKEG